MNSRRLNYSAAIAACNSFSSISKLAPKEAQDQIKAALGSNPLVSIHSYPGQDHAFARVGGLSYVPTAASLANQRTEAFLAKHLGKPVVKRPHQD